jgi:ribosomal protein S18 acetylase RimI-like enzyme
MPFTIGPGSVADVDSLNLLWQQMLEHHRTLAGDQWPVRDAEQSWQQTRAEYTGWLAAGTGLLLVASEGATPVGYLICRLNPSGATFDLGPIRGDVDGLAVSASVRGAGIGTALLEARRAELVARGCTYWSIGVVDANPDARRLYERVGFRPWIHELAAPLQP